MLHIFTDHPHQAGESYLQHQRFAAGVGGRLAGAACAALIHAVVPCLFKTTAGDVVEDMAATIRHRRAGMRTARALPASSLAAGE